MSQRAGRTLEQATRDYLAECVRDDGCLVHPRRRNYGEVWYGNRSRMSAHRAVFITAGNVLASGQIVRHKCDRIGCVDIDHLESGTQSQNVRDIYERDRRQAPWRHGETHPTAVLTAEIVGQLREAARNGAGLRALARDCGLQYTTVRGAVRGTTWAHLTDPAPVPNVRAGRSQVARQIGTTRPDECAKAAELAARGASLAEIAVALGVSRHTAFRMARAGQEIAS